MEEEEEEEEDAVIIPLPYMQRTAPRVALAIQVQRVAELRASLKKDNLLGIDNLSAFDYGVTFARGGANGHPGDTNQRVAAAAAAADDAAKSNGDDDHARAAPRRSLGDAFILHRFLRARQFDVEAARQAYLEMMEWRIANDVDDICDGIGKSDDAGGPPGDGRVFSEEEQARWDEVYRQDYFGVDKGGRPIYIERIGGISHERIVGVTTRERLYRKTIRSYEYLWRTLIPRCSKEYNEARRRRRDAPDAGDEREENRGTERDGGSDGGAVLCAAAAGGDDGNGNVIVDQMTSIMDIEGIRLIDFDSKLRSIMKIFTRMAAANYPETLFRMYIVRTPKIFSYIWVVVKQFIDPRTAAKIQVLDRDATPAKLLEDIDSEQLPKFLGGTADWE